MTQKTFYFFDYETFGVNPAIDRPCQFAGIRTDSDLNIIGEPLVIYCQPPNDYLPSPEACLVTGITPQTALERGLTEPEFIAKIHHEFSQPNTCAVGYNNVRFDDEVTRYTLYRNFYDPYGWSWQNGNSRWDLLDVMRAAYALRPEGITWPINEMGLPSFKLEHLSVKNGIEHSQAHDAMADVHATIELAKKLKIAQPKLFDYLWQHRDKNKLSAMIDLIKMTPLVHISGMFSAEQGCASWIAPIAWHPTNKNALIVVDLQQDPAPLLALNADDIRARLYTKRSELAQNELPIPLKLVHLNKCPVLAPTKVLRPAENARLGIDTDRCLKHLEQLTQSGLREKIVAVFSEQRTDFANDNVDSALYGGFFSAADLATMETIRRTLPQNLPALDISHADKRLAPLLFRYRARHYPATLTEQEMQKWQYHRRDYFEQHLDDYGVKLNNLLLEHQGNEKNTAILKALYRYVEQLIG